MNSTAGRCSSSEPAGRYAIDRWVNERRLPVRGVSSPQAVADLLAGHHPDSTT